MCNNYPNCNCSSCSQCQSCTQVTPTCNCTTTCTCTTEQFTEECPCGLQSTNCLIYTGDNLQDCDGNDYLFRGTNFNNFLSQLWDTVRCAAAPTTNTINYTGANIRNCDNTATVVATGSSLTVALNNIWNVVKCWYTDLSLLISQKQPVWQLSNTILVGSSQPAPFNTLPTALDEIAKYHFAKNDVIISLQTGTYTLSNNLLITNKFQYNLVITSQSGNKTDVLLNTQGFYIEVSNQGVATFSNLSITSFPDTNAAIRVNNLAIANINNCNIFIPNQNTNVGKYYISVSEKAELFVYNTVFTTNTSEKTKVKAPFYISTFASLRADDCVFGSLGQGFSSISVNDVGSSSYFGNIKFNSIYNSVFYTANNSSLYVSGNNDFIGEYVPTGYENTVDYLPLDSPSVFYTEANSSVIVNNLRVKNSNLTAIPNNLYVADTSGNVIDWRGNLCLGASSNSKIVASECYFENFVRPIIISRNGIISLFGNVFVDVAYGVNGYVGQLSYGWVADPAFPTTGRPNKFVKDSSVTLQTNPGVLNKPFSYDNNFVIFSGWSSPLTIIPTL
jgi:hypothetical protein